MKPPKFCDYPELWWDDWFDAPMIVYPAGPAEFFDTNLWGVGFWREADDRRIWADVVVIQSDRYRFIAELK